MKSEHEARVKQYSEDARGAKAILIFGTDDGDVMTASCVPRDAREAGALVNAQLSHQNIRIIYDNVTKTVQVVL
jgi:hypothetical protein